MDEKKFKKDNRPDVCSRCPKKHPCALAESICELVTPCGVCEIRETCTSLCIQMKTYLSRGSKGSPDQLSFDASEHTQNHYSLVVLNSQDEKIIERDSFSIKDVEWNILSTRDQEILQKLFIEDMTYEEIGNELNLPVQNVYVFVHGDKNHIGALTKLKEFAITKKAFKRYGKYIPDKHQEVLKALYIENKKAKDIKKLDETIQNTYYRINKAKELLRKFETLVERGDNE